MSGSGFRGPLGLSGAGGFGCCRALGCYTRGFFHLAFAALARCGTAAPTLGFKHDGQQFVIMVHRVHGDALEQFLGQYMAAEIDADAIPAYISALLIGAKPAKHGYTAIVNKRDAAKLPAFVRLTPADLETAMIHLEKE